MWPSEKHAVLQIGCDWHRAQVKTDFIRIVQVQVSLGLFYRQPWFILCPILNTYVTVVLGGVFHMNCS